MKIILSALAISSLSGLAHASVFEGTSEQAWSSSKEEVPADREEIIADIQDLINDCTQKTTKLVF